MAKLKHRDAEDLFKNITSTVQMLVQAHDKLDKDFVVNRVEWALEQLEKWRNQTAPSNKIKRVLKAIQYYNFLTELKREYDLKGE